MHSLSLSFYLSLRLIEHFVVFLLLFHFLGILMASLVASEATYLICIVPNASSASIGHIWISHDIRYMDDGAQPLTQPHGAIRLTNDQSGGVSDLKRPPESHVASESLV
uniref:Uncharacterized protein n=1 Tax=Anopheles darlingi TaxID=43151 RepID=A0A2M4DE83_ANODA